MITKLISFRPDKRFVNEEDLEGKMYTCHIKDGFTKAENHITIPVYFTIIQHNIPKACYNRIKSQQQHDSSHKSYQFLEKMCFYLVGSLQTPLLSKLSTSNLKNVDRIEFKGHIGYECPIFEIISQLPALRKVSFFINPCKQGTFIADSNTGKDEKMENRATCSKRNLLVTNVKFVLENCTMATCSCKESKAANHQLIPDPPSNESSIENVLKQSNKQEYYIKDNLGKMVTCLLRRVVKQCPNIKQLFMDVPNFNGVKDEVENSIRELFSLKPTRVDCSSGRLLVRKKYCDLPFSQEIDASPFDDNIDASGSCHKEEQINAQMVTSSDEDVDVDLNNEELESSPCLFDMSKLLGSMLGIPTSSLPPGSSSSSPSSTPCPSDINYENNAEEPQKLNDSPPPALTTTVTSATSLTTCNNLVVESNRFVDSVNKNKVTTSSHTSTVEVITYAAAAASAAATNTTSTYPTTNNYRHHQNIARASGTENSNYHHRHHHLHHNINEGSRRAFIRDGEGSTLLEAGVEESTKSNKKPSIPYVADLGKPVFVTSASCKSPHKRGV